MSEEVCKHLKIDNGRCLYCKKTISAPKKDDNKCYPEWQLDDQMEKKLALEVLR